jgi:phosphate transport system substrate-binding protein
MIMALLLSGCGIIAEKPEPTPTPEPQPAFVFTPENFPAVEGSAAAEPLAEAVAAVMLGKSREDVAGFLNMGNTEQSYADLMSGKCGLVLAAEPSNAVLQQMASTSPCELAPVAKDALVFIVSRSNPIDSLTVDQLRKIYTGEYTNWSQVGGDDVPIEAFTRGDWSGSQAAMENLVMGGESFGTTAMDISENIFDGSAGAIGYSLYYYAGIMRMAGDYKIISVEDVAPTNDAVAAGTYPLILNYCAAISGAAAEDSPEYVLWAWLQSTEGQEFIAAQGYVPAR